MLNNPSHHNQNLASKIVDAGSGSNGHQNSLVVEGGCYCINMILAANVLSRSKYCGTLQTTMGKEAAPPGIPL